MAFTQTNVLVVTLPNKVGALATVCEKLAKKGVNINFVYGSTSKGRAATCVVIGCGNHPTAGKVLARL